MSGSKTDPTPAHFDLTVAYEGEIRPLVEALLNRCKDLGAPCVVQVITKSTPETMDVETSQAGLRPDHDFETKMHHLAVIGASATTDHDAVLSLSGWSAVDRGTPAKSPAP